MLVSEAAAMFAGAALHARGPATWADLGAGDGTFTLALAESLAPGSTIHAMDRDGSALKRIVPYHHSVRIHTHRGDFMKPSWPFANLDGILMANSLHFVRDKAAFIRTCEPHMAAASTFLVVEYDTDHANPWVPYPLSRSSLGKIFGEAGYPSIQPLGTRPSAYNRAQLYAVLIAR
jgi:ubiquinone/menaquinone biosynthesis C-methylase UbiE